VPDYVSALRQCNARIVGGRAWYDGVRTRYSGAPLK
jgi:hypothetical protein